MNSLPGATESLAIQVVWGAVAVLAVLSLYLLFTSVIIRYAQGLVQQQKDKRRNLYYALVIEFITTESEDLEALEAVVISPFDVETMVEIVSDLMKQLDGQEYPRLQVVMAMPVIRNHFRKKLFSAKRIEQTEGCLYFALVSVLQPDETKRIRVFVDSSHPLLAHAAASVMMASPKMIDRFEALRRMARRQGISKLALLEMLHRFHDPVADHFDDEAERLGLLLQDRDIPAKNLAVLIRGVVDVGYAQLLVPLFDLMESGYRKDDDEVLEALIYTMGRFQFGPAGEWFLEETVAHPNPKIRLATAQAFGSFQDDRYVPALMALAQDPEITVRIRALFALVAIGPSSAEALSELSARTAELKELVDRVRLETEVAA